MNKSNFKDMMNNVKINLDLLPVERKKLSAHKIKFQDIPKFTVKDLSVMLSIPTIRAMELYALAEFQSIPSIGIKFSRDLISLGYYSLDELKDKEGAKLIEDLEFLTGAWIDPCVEDQCRLVVHYANNRDNTKRWWDFTAERKTYRIAHGYQENRPEKAWHELQQYDPK